MCRHLVANLASKCKWQHQVTKFANNVSSQIRNMVSNFANNLSGLLAVTFAPELVNQHNFDLRVFSKTAAFNDS